MKNPKFECGVYKITSPEGKVYIGSSTNLTKRFNKYRSLTDVRQSLLRNSLIKHGYENHVIEIVVFCPEEMLHEFERELGLALNVLSDNGLNSILPGHGDYPAMYRKELLNRFAERRHSEDTKKKMSEKKKGGMHPNSREVIHLPTGRVYHSVREAAESEGINRFTLARWIRTGKNCGFGYKQKRTPK
jgi:hypothetical protein